MWVRDWQLVYPFLTMERSIQSWLTRWRAATRAQMSTRLLRDRLSHQFERITIDGDTVAFFEGGKPLEACYAGDGCEMLTSKKGNRMDVKFRFGVVLASSHLVG
ncbi:ZinT/AdcA family metal-binding protein [Mesorhizobium loti]|uniref:ZinT/AdcA family metal-binding protein n=1 Tax=Rhizobium loti TaxID=381 RepID=UPI001CB7A9FB|nr:MULTISPECIES: ZinT/AdcA family metal-binding protein [Mesorhizobium]